jgi:dUTPase
MLVTRIRQVKLPTRGTSRSAGLDFYVPMFKDNMDDFYTDICLKNQNISNDEILRWMSDGQITVPPHTHVLIPSGLKINLTTVNGFVYNVHDSITFIAHNKSSVGILQLDVAATVGDEDFQGELHLSVTNTSTKPVIIDQGMKLVQFLLVPIKLDDVIEVKEDDLFLSESERFDGCLGSTGKF